MRVSPLTKKLLANISAQLGKIGESIEKHEEAAAKRDERQNVQHQQPRAVSAVVTVPSAVEIKKSDTDAKQERWHQGWNLFIQAVLTLATIGAFLAAAYYAYYAKKQLRIMNDTYNSSIESFRLDERAWVELTGEGASRFANGFKCEMRPANVGKTVATSVRMKAIPTIRTGEFEEREIHSLQEGLFGAQSKDVPFAPIPKTIAPNTISTIPVTIGCEATTNYPSGGHVFHFVIGRIEYCDVFRVRHWKNFCFYVTNASGEVWYCQEGNDEDKNQEVEPIEQCAP